MAAANATLVMLAATPAQAELTLCNRTSYQMEAAIGLEKRANVATRGWFRIDPGQCRQVVDGALDADMVYVHARTPPVYGSAPLPQNGQCRVLHSRRRLRHRQCARLPGEPAGALFPRRGRPIRRKGRRSTLRKKPTTTTRRRGSPAYKGFW